MDKFDEHYPVSGNETGQVANHTTPAHCSGNKLTYTHDVHGAVWWWVRFQVGAPVAFQTPNYFA